MATLEEYLGSVETIVYELSVIAGGQQVFVHETAARRMSLPDTIRYGNLSAPKSLVKHGVGKGWASFWLGDARLVVWPVARYAHTEEREESDG